MPGQGSEQKSERDKTGHNASGYIKPKIVNFSMVFIKIPGNGDLQQRLGGPIRQRGKTGNFGAFGHIAGRNFFQQKNGKHRPQKPPGGINHKRPVDIRAHNPIYSVEHNSSVYYEIRKKAPRGAHFCEIYPTSYLIFLILYFLLICEETNTSSPIFFPNNAFP